MAPGAPSSPGRLENGLAELQRRGYRIKMPFDAAEFYGRYDHGFSNGSAQHRTEVLHGLVADQDVDVLIAARGQYGSNALLPLLDFPAWKSSRKLLVGYSDVTLLLVALYGRTGLPTIHGPMVSAEFAEATQSEESRASAEALLEMLSNPEFLPVYQGASIVDGKSAGKLLAGNLMVLVSLLGTPWDVSYDHHILVVEDVGESPFRIDRALRQLEQSGKFERLSGLVFGRFKDCLAKNGPTVRDILLECSERCRTRYGFPVLEGVEFGHRGANFPIPLGCRARIETTQLELLESPLTLG